MTHPKLTIGTRGSALALWQANYVKELLTNTHPNLTVDIEIIHTQGDKILDVALSKIGDKGLFTKELESALLEKRVDLCVHSMKDMPTLLPHGLEISAMPPRADARDILINFSGHSFASLPAGSRVATSSLRRSALLTHLRPDLKLCEIRGNVDTRINKVRNGEFDAIVLAAAGVTRMGLSGDITDYFDPTVLVPAVGQGAIGIETRVDDGINELLAPLSCADTMQAVQAERFIMRALEGGCQVPIGAYARLEPHSTCKDTPLPSGRSFVIDAFVSSLDGTKIARTHLEGTPAQSLDMAKQALNSLKAQGAENILEDIR